MNLKFWSRTKRTASSASTSAPLSEMSGPVRRRRSFMAAAISGMFKGASAENDSWTATPVTPDSIISQKHMALVARSREQWSNNDYVRGFIRLIRQNVVGPIGVTMQAKVTTPRGKLDKETNAALEADFCEWGERGNCDVTGELSWRAAQCLAAETAARDGEFIVRKIYGEEAGPHGFAIQFIDPMRLPTWYENTRMANGGFIRHGIEFNSYGRKLAYHFSSTDESDAHYYSVSGRGFVRVPADEIIHGFLVEMVGQRRGLPWASTSLFRLRNTKGFEDAAVQNARAGASKMGFIKYEPGYGPEMDDGDSVTVEAEPLHFQELPDGADLVEFNPQFPSGETAPFLKSQLRGAATGMGVPYNELANDLEGVNFSSIRQLTLDAREHYKEIQEWLIETLVTPVRDAHLKWRLLNAAIKVKGKPIPMDRLKDCRKVEWQARRWQWIDPNSDIDAALKAVRGGMASISQYIREQGRDPEAVFLEIASDIEAMKAAGIPEKFIALFLQGKIMPEPQQQAPNNQPDKKAA